MGYTTEFSGVFKVLPKPIEEDLVDYLVKFAETRRMKRNLDSRYGIDGEFYVYGSGFMGQDKEKNIIDSNYPPSTQPGLWCQWIPSSDGSVIKWDGGEKFYDYVEWLKYIEENFLIPFGRYLDGDVIWQGEDIMDRGRIIADKDFIKVAYESGGENNIKLTSRNDFKNNQDFILGKKNNELFYTLSRLDIPSHMREGIEAYIKRGKSTGGFLQSVIENNFVGAFSKADGQNKKKLEEYATLLYNHFPENSWGSKEAYKNWVEKGGLEGVEE